MPLIAVVFEAKAAAVNGTVGVAEVQAEGVVRAADGDLELRYAEAGVDKPQPQPGLGGGRRSTIGVAEDLAGLGVAGWVDVCR